MTVRVILKSQEGLCVEYKDVDNIVMSKNNMIVIQYTSLWGKVHTKVIEKNDIRYIKVIPGKEE